MTVTRTIVLAITVLLFGSNGIAEDIRPSEIIEKAKAAYESMQTYKAEGTITSDIDTGAVKMKTETSFTILLKKPNLYLISWAQKNESLPGMVQSGAVWNDGTQSYLHMGMMKAYAKMTSDEIALSGATGISGGAALTIPSLFLPVFKEPVTLFSRLKNPKHEKTEMVGGEDCYVISGPSAISKKETVWISKTSDLIRKYSRSIEPPEAGRQMPEMTDEQLEEAIKGLGQEVTEESKKRMRKLMETSRALLKNAKLKGSSTESHVEISSPEVSKNDFQFELPEGTVLKKSLFGEVLGGSK